MTSDGGEAAKTVELVHRAQANELEALDLLFERYYPRVLRIVRARVTRGVRRDLESSDLAQEAMIRAIRGFDRYEVRSETELIHWFARIVENAVRDADRRRKRLKRDREHEIALDHVHAAMASGSLSFEPAAEVPMPDQQAHDAELGSRIEQALSELGDAQREVVMLRVWGGGSWSEIARLAGRPSPEAARMMYAKALHKLQKRMRTAPSD